jgi:sialate O-acetylesterase
MWGWADPGQAVSVTIAGRSEVLTAAADEDGKWSVKLPAMPANDSGFSILVTSGGDEPIVIEDVLVGEVWLCSGQSNMAWILKNTANGPEEAASANDNLLRFYEVEVSASSKPVEDVDAGWKPAAPEHAPNFTAVGYYFGKDLREHLGVPVGIIRSAYGGTIAEPWISYETVNTAPEMEVYRQRIAELEAEHPGLMEGFDAEYKRRIDLQAEIGRERNRLRAAGVPEDQWPRSPGIPTLEPGGRYLPAVLYNAMIAPLVPYGIRGFTWYQGESNGTYFTEQYAGTMRTLIADWRGLWNDSDMPFVMVQLANFRDPQEVPNPNDTWPLIREAQRQVAAKDPNVGMVVTIDVGEAKDIHPRDKRTVGQRLARWARAKVYGEAGLLPTGPQLTNAAATPEGVRLQFTNTADGLRLLEGNSVKGITVHTEGTEPTFATAQIVAPNAIFVRAPDLTGTITVRHAWADNPIWNVVNSEGIPLEPFQVIVER